MASTHNSSSPIALVVFFGDLSPERLSSQPAVWHKELENRGAEVHFQVQIDLVLAGGEMPYQGLQIALFPQKEDARKAYQDLYRSVQHYAFLVKPDLKLPRRVRSFHFAAPLLSRIYGTRKIRPMKNLDQRSNPRTSPTSETVQAFRESKLDQPFWMMNLNKYREKARYPEASSLTGFQAYGKYSKLIFPRLISVRGYPAFIGKVKNILGPQDAVLHDQWETFLMVHYPSRKHLLRMMSNMPFKTVFHREAGLKRAVLMPCTPLS